MTTEIKVCMGNACFIKGNQQNLEFIKQFIKKSNMDAKTEIIGSLCKEKCEHGPRIIVDDKEYTNITLKDIEEILENI